MLSNDKDEQDYKDYQEYQAYQAQQQTNSPVIDQPADITKPEPTPSPVPSIKAHLDSNFTAAHAEGKEPPSNFLQQLEQTIGMSAQGLKKGLENTATGKLLRGRMPEDATPEERQSRAFEIAQGIGSLAGDLPLMAASGVLGAAVGGIEGGTVGSIVPGVGTAVGAVGLGAVAGAATAFAVPQGISKYLNDLYTKGEATTPGEVTSRIMSQAWETIKGATTGAATAVTGGAAGAVAGSLAGVTSELATMTTVSHLLDGHLPTLDDYLVNAAAIGGLHAVGVLQPKLMRIFENTGEHPADVAAAVEKDPVLKQQLLTGSENEPPQAASTTISPLDPSTPAKEATPQEESLPTNEHPDLTSAREAVRSKIVDRPDLPSTAWIEKIKDGYKSVITAVKDDLDPLRVMTESAVEEASSEEVSTDLDPTKNPYILARSFRDWGGKLYTTLTHSTVDFKDPTKFTGEGLVPILKDIPEKDWKGLNDYMVSARVLEKSEQGIKQPVSVEDAKKIVDADENKFEPVFRRVVDFQNRVKQYAVDSGILSEHKSELFDQLNQDYVPLNKLLDVDPLSGKREGNKKNYQALGDSERLILNPLQSIFENTMSIMKAAEENRVKQSIVELPELVENGFAVKVDEPGPLGKDEMSVKYDGEVQKYRFPPNVAEAIKAMDYSPQFTSSWAKLFAAPLKLATNALRVGVIGDPGFGIRHGIRAVGIAEVQTKYPSVPLTGIVESMGEVFGHTDDYYKFISSGAANGSLDKVMQLMESRPWENPNPTMMQKVKNKVWSPGNDPWYTKSWNALFSPVEVSHAIVQASDMLPKFREFKRGGGLEGDVNKTTQAAFDARNVSVDYTRQGALVKLISFSRPFLNVDMQGTFRTLESLKSPKTVALATAIITLPEIANFVANKDDERYKNAPSWMHATAMVIPIDHWVPSTAQEAASFSPLKSLTRQLPDGSWEVNKGPTLRIPRFFTTGLLFGAIPHMIMDHYANENPKAFEALRERLITSFLPFGAPTLVAPALEQASNRNYFAHGPLVPSYLERDVPQYRYAEYTHETAKQLGKLFGYLPQIGPDDAPLEAPIVVDNYIRAWGGTLGQYTVDLIDKGLHAVGIGKIKNEIPKDWDEQPIVKEFFTHFPSSKAQSIQDFEGNFKENDKYINTAKDLAKTDPVAAMAFAEAHPDLMQNLKDTHESINNVLFSVNGINKMDMPADQKKQLIHTALFQAISMAQEGNKMVNDFRKSMKQNKK